MEEFGIVWSEYMLYRMDLRGFERDAVEQVLRLSTERYSDSVTGRLIVVGRHRNQLVVIPYEVQDANLIPVTIHVTSRGQINYRIKSGRFCHE